MAIGKRLQKYLNLAVCLLFFTSCSTQLIEIDPEIVTDTGDVEITCNAREDTKGLLNYTGDVFIHVGLITSMSEHKDDWRYVKFNWGSRQKEALATPAGKNKWTYTIKNVRKFFGVPEDEQIYKIAFLFRSGGCMQAYCKVLRSKEGGNLYIPISNTNSIAKQ